MLDSMISTMSSNYMSYLGSGNVPKPMGTAFPTVVPYRVFPTRTARLRSRWAARNSGPPSAAPSNGRNWRQHPDYATNADAHPEPRGAGTAAGRASSARGPWPTGSTGCRRRAFRLAGAEFPGGRGASAIRGARDVSRMEHPTAGRHRVTGTPVKLSETPGSPGAPAPLLGQHTGRAPGTAWPRCRRGRGACREGVIYEVQPDLPGPPRCRTE